MGCALVASTFGYRGEAVQLNPLGYKSARRVLELGRVAFFAQPDQDLLSAVSAEVAADDLLP